MTFHKAAKLLSQWNKGLVPDQSTQLQIIHSWIKKFGTGGCDCYPYTTCKQMLKDLAEH